MRMLMLSSIAAQARRSSRATSAPAVTPVWLTKSSLTTTPVVGSNTGFVPGTYIGTEPVTVTRTWALNGVTTGQNAPLGGLYSPTAPNTGKTLSVLETARNSTNINVVQNGNGIAIEAAPPQTSDTAILEWDDPVWEDYGVPLTGLTNIKVSWGQVQGGPYPNEAIVGAGVQTYTITNLATGIWFFQLSATNANGYGDFGIEITKVV